MQIYYDTVSLGRSDVAGSAQNVYNVLHKYDNRFTYSGTTIRVNDTFDVVFSIIYGGTDYLGVDGRRLNGMDMGAMTVFATTTIISNTIVYMLFKSNDGNNTPYSAICWIHENGMDYFGVGVNGTSSGQIDTMNFTNKTTNNVYFTLKRHAQFSLISPNIIFIATGIIADNGGNYTALSELRSCSTTVFDSTISINHSNYYAIGTNSLIRIDGV